jgi:drug/metabolite transporter (DMT)-like permease
MTATSPSRNQPRPATWLIAACLLAVYVIWGTTYFAIKVGIEGMPPFLLVGTRFLAAGGLLLGWQMLRRQPMPTLVQWRGAAVVGFLLLVAGNGLVAVAEHWVSSGATVAMISTVPFVIALWSGAFGEWPKGLEWIAIVIGGVGAAIMLSGRDLQASGTGTFIILIGIACWALGTVLSRRIDVPHGPSGFGAEMLMAGVIAIIVSLALREQWTLPHASRIWWAWSYLVVFGSVIGFSAYRFLVERVSATLAATYAYVNPPVALLVGWWLGKENFSSNVLVGLPVVLCSVALHAWIQTREPRPPIKTLLSEAPPSSPSASA